MKPGKPPMTMTTKPTALAQAIARHKAAQAASDADPDSEDHEHLRDAENEAIDELTLHPRYLTSEASRAVLGLAAAARRGTGSASV
jgi:hypothetical protein